MLDILELRLTLLRDLGFQPRMVLDIGAYQGEWSMFIHEIWPAAKVFMVEANEDCRTVLSQIDWAEGYEIALLGDKKRKQVNYYTAQGATPTGSSIFFEQSSFFDNYKVRKLPMVTLDYVVAKNKLFNIDFLKIDTQGSELNILKGGRETLKDVKFILLETQNLEFNQGAPFVDAVLAAMKGFDFWLYDITEIRHLPTGEMVQMDLLFVKKNSKFLKRGKLL